MEKLTGHISAVLPTPAGPFRVGAAPAAGSIELSLILPTFKEAQNIRATLQAACGILRGVSALAFEVIVVDDNSPDQTAQLALDATDEFPEVLVMCRTSEAGLATAVIRGWQAARGSILAVMDADLQHPPEILANLVAEMRSGRDLAVASRHVQGGGVGSWNLLRRIVSRGAQAIGLVILLIGVFSLVLASRKDPVIIAPGKHLSFRRVLGRVVPHGMGLALGGVGYSVLATFVTLFYLSRNWSGAALCLTAFGLAFIVARLLFIQTINRFGGFPVAVACLAVESVGLLLLWIAPSPWMAMAGAAITGFGFSLVFPALGVEAVKRVTENDRGSALGVFTAFADVSFFLVGPLAGAVIGVFGYASAFLFALLCVLAALGLAIVLMRLKRPPA